MAVNTALYPPVTSSALRGGCYLTSIGGLDYAPGEQYPRSGHPADFDFVWSKGRVLSDFAMVLITAGQGEWQLRGRHVESIRAGDVLFIVPGQWHRYRPVRSVGWTEKWVCLRGSVVYGFMRAGILSDKCARWSGRGDQHLLERMDRLCEDVFVRPDHNLPSWGARALALLLEASGDSAGYALANEMGGGLVSLALRFIEENSHRRIQVDAVAFHCGCGRRTLERHFKAAELPPVGQVILRSKLEQAKILLRESNLLVKEVAFACGFNGVQQFILSFRRQYGESPGEWRRSAQPVRARRTRSSATR